MAEEIKTTRIEKLNIPLLPEISEDQNILNALMGDMEGKVDDKTKDFYYKTIIPRLFSCKKRCSWKTNENLYG